MIQLVYRQLPVVPDGSAYVGFWTVANLTAFRAGAGLTAYCWHRYCLRILRGAFAGSPARTTFYWVYRCYYTDLPFHTVLFCTIVRTPFTLNTRSAFSWLFCSGLPTVGSLVSHWCTPRCALFVCVTTVRYLFSAGLCVLRYCDSGVLPLLFTALLPANLPLPCRCALHLRIVCYLHVLLRVTPAAAVAFYVLFHSIRFFCCSGFTCRLLPHCFCIFVYRFLMHVPRFRFPAVTARFCGSRFGLRAFPTVTTTHGSLYARFCRSYQFWLRVTGSFTRTRFYAPAVGCSRFHFLLRISSSFTPPAFWCSALRFTLLPALFYTRFCVRIFTTGFLRRSLVHRTPSAHTTMPFLVYRFTTARTCGFWFWLVRSGWIHASSPLGSVHRRVPCTHLGCAFIHRALSLLQPSVTRSQYCATVITVHL